jgi:mannose-6-phosphate isomerase-like protein (cupin superfamily)
MQYIELFKIAVENKSFLKVLFTHRHLQVAVSNIQPGESSGEELWDTSVAVLVVWGQGHAVVGGEERDIGSGCLVCIAANTEYIIVNLGTEPLKLLLIFSSAVFKDGTDEGSKLSEIMDPYRPRISRSIM